jgi:DNA processing protein
LRSGATLVRHVDDILEELQHWVSRFVPAPLAVAADEPLAHQPSVELPSADNLLNALGPSPTPIDVLVQSTGISVSECQQRLLMLELDGKVTQQAGGWVRLAAPW